MATTRHTEGQQPAGATGLRYRGIRPGYAVLHVATGGLIGIFAFTALITLASLTVGLLPTVIGAVVCAFLLVGFNTGLAALHRSRMRAFLGLHIVAPTPPNRHGWAGLLQVLTRAAFWKSLTYNAIVGLVLFILATVLLAFLAIGVILATGTVTPLPVPMPPLWPDQGHSPVATVTGFALAMGAILLVPYVARAVAYGDGLVAVALLGRTSTDELAEQVVHLAQTRTDTVDAADAERRRIERDLHDGTQQRLTALAMNLGVARATLPDLSPPAQAALEEAHAEAKAALVELRGIVRGLHPAVLDDRGLDAALSGLAARSPVPVSLDVHVPGRLPRPVEAVAYFVVSEALTNVVKHSGASRAQVVARVDGGTLRLRIVDDGAGGADDSRGTGLTGLRQRVASVDGTLTLESPLGGPTVLEAWIPCGS